MARYKKQKGAVLVLSMIFLCVFAVWAVSIVSMSGTNLQLADNHQKVNHTRASAESGLEILRLLLADLVVPASVAPADRLAAIEATLQARLTEAGMTNIIATYDGAQIALENVTLCSQTGQSFTATISQTDSETLQVQITGYNGQLTRTIQANFNFVPAGNRLFDYGVATRGPISLTGNAELRGLNDPSEASVYIESFGEDEALSLIGSSEIEGNAGIVNPDAYVTGAPKVGGTIAVGVDAVEFPVMDTATFEQYVQNIINSETETTGNLTFQNVRIIAGTDPDFSGNINLNGIIFIESPNAVTFIGNIVITGIIVGDGDAEAPLESDSLTFRGNLFSFDVSNLPDTEDFAGLREQTGTFLLAPGFSTAFHGNFQTVNGVIAANGVTFTGNAGGTVRGTILNYSESAMSFTGNPTITFDRPDSDDNPAGFEADAALEYDPGSYCEIVL